MPSLDNSTLDTDAEQPVPSDDVALVPDVAPSNTFIDEHFPRLQALDMSLDMQTPCLPSMGPVLSGLYSAKTPTDSLMSQDLSRYSLNIQPSASSFATAPTARRQRSWPLDNVQEACLLRYWIEDISHWVRGLTRAGSPFTRRIADDCASLTCVTRAGISTWWCRCAPKSTLTS